MTTAAQAPASYPPIIIHHLSDLHYQQLPQGKSDNPLIRYRGYLDQQPDRRPDLIVVTGDLTATGNTNDLRAIADMLRVQFSASAWAGTLAQHIFVVPGPRDVNWEGKNPPSLTTFYEAFYDFGLPSRDHRQPQAKASVQTPPGCVAYAIDTCYALEECAVEMREQYHQYGNSFHEFVNQYKQVHNRPSFTLFGRPDRSAEIAALHDKYLRLTETSDLTLLDAGRVNEEDLKAFDEWRKSLTSTPLEPLKILITHHPLAVEPKLEAPPGTAHQRARHHALGFGALADGAGAAGFHLALHGHIHKPQVLSDLSLLQEPAGRHPLRQVGAGSLGDGRTFNEMTAIYGDDGADKHWRLEIRTINLRDPKPEDAKTWVLLNRTEDSAKKAEDLKREKSIRGEFEKGVQTVMRTFSEDVYDTQPEDPFDRSHSTMLPQRALQSVEDIIQRVVYPGFGARTRLYLKDKHSSKTVPQLTATYLAPLYSDAGPITYPYSLAALALVLGRTIVFPDDVTKRLTPEDYRWIRQSKKDQELINALEALVREPPPTGLPAQEEAQRYQALLTKLKLSMADDGHTDPLTGKDFYREMPVQTERPTYPVFICLPYPKRPPEGVGAALPEVAVLVVSVPSARESLAATAQGGTAAKAIEGEAISKERIAMLESLTQLIGTILISSSAAGRPKGVWDDRLKF